jgi:hypothetical protein
VELSINRKKGTFTIIFFNVLFLNILLSSSPSPSPFFLLQAHTINSNDLNSNYTDNVNNTTLLYGSSDKPYGLNFGQWSSKWWQWAYSIPQNINPAYDDTGKYCAINQNGPVWFLTSAYKHPVDRYCTIPSDKSILFPILNSECSFAEFPNLKTDVQLRQCAKIIQDSVIKLDASINNKNISGLQNFRIQSPLFNFSLPKNNILGLRSQNNIPSVSDGNWIFLKPLPVGDYKISFKGGLKNIANNTSNQQNDFAFAGPYGWDNRVTYHTHIQ